MKEKLVVLYAEWCPKSNMMLPLVDEIEEHYGEKLSILKIDVDFNPEAMVYYEVELVPTFILYKDGQEFGRMVGMIGEKTLYRRIDELFLGC